MISFELQEKITVFFFNLDKSTKDFLNDINKKFQLTKGLVSNKSSFSLVNIQRPILDYKDVLKCINSYFLDGYASFFNLRRDTRKIMILINQTRSILHILFFNSFTLNVMSYFQTVNV